MQKCVSSITIATLVSDMALQKTKVPKELEISSKQKTFLIQFEAHKPQGQFCKICRLVFDFPFLHYVQFFVATIYPN